MGRAAWLMLNPARMGYNRPDRAGPADGFYVEISIAAARAGHGVGLEREALIPNCLDHGGVVGTGVCGGLRRSAHSDSEGARRLQHGGGAALLQCRTEKRQIGFLLPGSSKANLRELLVSSSGIQPLLVPPQAHPPTHRPVKAGVDMGCSRPTGAPAGRSAFLAIFPSEDRYELHGQKDAPRHGRSHRNQTTCRDKLQGRDNITELTFDLNQNG